MSILATAVLQGNVVIASFSANPGQFDKDFTRLLSHDVVKVEQKISGTSIFTFLRSPTLIFACVSPISCDQKIPLDYLDNLAKKWGASVGSVFPNSPSHSYDKHLARCLEPKLTEYLDVESQIKKAFEETQRSLGESVSKAYDRQAQLEDLDSRSENLLSTSEEFKNQATNLKWKMRCSYIKSYALWVAVIFVFICFVLRVICGGFDLKPRCR